MIDIRDISKFNAPIQDSMGALGGSNSLLSAGADGKIIWKPITHSDFLPIASKWTTVGSNINRVGGNVGIEVPNPTYKLHVAGAIKTTRILSTGGGDIASNIAVGNNSLRDNTTGFINLAIGNNALLEETTGYGHIAIGNAALSKTKGYYYNTAIGSQALTNCTVGVFNTAIGPNSLLNNISGSYNLGLGYGTLQSLTQGTANIAIGDSSLGSLTNANSNTAIGQHALYALTTGGSNTAIGGQALRLMLTGTGNLGIGADAGFSNTAGVNNLFLGNSAGYNNKGSNNLLFGASTAYGATLGSNNTILGHYTAQGLVEGANNTIIGANISGLGAATSNWVILADGAGTRRLNIDNVGNVGFGINLPTCKMHVVGDKFLMDVSSLAANQTAFQIKGKSTSAGTKTFSFLDENNVEQWTEQINAVEIVSTASNRNKRTTAQQKHIFQSASTGFAVTLYDGTLQYHSLGADPTTVIEGQTWYSNVEKSLKVRTNTSSKTLINREDDIVGLDQAIGSASHVLGGLFRTTRYTSQSNNVTSLLGLDLVEGYNYLVRCSFNSTNTITFTANTGCTLAVSTFTALSTASFVAEVSKIYTVKRLGTIVYVF